MPLKSLHLLRSLSPEGRGGMRGGPLGGPLSRSAESLPGPTSPPLAFTRRSAGGCSTSSGLSSSDGLERSASGSSGTPLLSGEDNINVVVRVRPLSARERQNGERSVVEFPGDGQVLVALPGQKSKLYSYNAVFEPAATQEDVLRHCGITRLLEMAVEGFSCTAFCYGQTGSGKTHTLTGPPHLFANREHLHSEEHGLVVRSFVYLFQLLQQKSDVHFVLKASFLEIYNEKVIDLLNAGGARKPLAVRWSKKARGFFVENLFTVDCEQLDDLFAVLEEGMRNRAVGAHSMNEHSSRSHTMLTVHISSERPAEGGVFLSRRGKVNFVDLAGSEVTKKTHSRGTTLEEANNINKSLMVLGYCIASLSDSKRKSGHIPYRDSKLTKLLADSLAGSGVTLMIACISPSRSNASESSNTLRYAARAKKIRTKPVVKMDPREALILKLKRELDGLQNENDHLKSILHYHGQPARDSGEWARGAPEGAAGEGEEALERLEAGELAELARLYVRDNRQLRRDNAELFSAREALLRDQELLFRENERLLKKLEDVNSVCCRSPIIPARPALSSESSSGGRRRSDVWINPRHPSTS